MAFVGEFNERLTQLNKVPKFIILIFQNFKIFFFFLSANSMSFFSSYFTL